MAGRTDEEMLRERMTAHPRPEDMVFSPLGGPYPVPNMKIELSNGMVVPESVFGSPPPDLTPEEINVWYADREFQLMSGGDENWPVDTTGDE